MGIPHPCRASIDYVNRYVKCPQKHYLALLGKTSSNAFRVR